ncbi:MAG: ABC transporter ATP-binding protein [Clostridia bacterium]|nr:ABC transporter ATP-binding protein [Clostridia bacterium]
MRWLRRAPLEEVHAVNGVTLRVRRGEIFGILGPNGCGKSTLVRIVSTLLLPDEGEVKVFGHDVVREPHAVRRLINRVSVEAAFFKKLSSWENLCYAARLYGMSPRAIRGEVARVADRLGLPWEKLFTSMEHLSRGQQQKVAIARALLTSPVLLLLDEPTTGLDPRSKRDVQTFVEEVRREHDATILLTSHDMDEVERLCDRVAVMNDGRVIAVDTPQKLKQRYAGPGGTLEDVFLRLTGRDWEEVLANEA